MRRTRVAGRPSVITFPYSTSRYMSTTLDRAALSDILFLYLSFSFRCLYILALLASFPFSPYPPPPPPVSHAEPFLCLPRCPFPALTFVYGEIALPWAAGITCCHRRHLRATRSRPRPDGSRQQEHANRPQRRPSARCTRTSSSTWVPFQCESSKIYILREKRNGSQLTSWTTHSEQNTFYRPTSRGGRMTPLAFFHFFPAERVGVGDTAKKKPANFVTARKHAGGLVRVSVSTRQRTTYGYHARAPCGGDRCDDNVFVSFRHDDRPATTHGRSETPLPVLQRVPQRLRSTLKHGYVRGKENHAQPRGSLNLKSFQDSSLRYYVG